MLGPLIYFAGAEMRNLLNMIHEYKSSLHDMKSSAFIKKNQMHNTITMSPVLCICRLSGDALYSHPNLRFSPLRRVQGDLVRREFWVAHGFALQDYWYDAPVPLAVDALHQAAPAAKLADPPALRDALAAAAAHGA